MKVLTVLLGLMASSQALELTCFFINEIDLAYVGPVYYCSNGQLKEANSMTTLESVGGVHSDGKSNADVRAMDVQSDRLVEHFPQGVENFFPNLLMIEWFNGNLVSITAEDLRPFPALRVLHLYVNKIVSLDSNLFQHTPELVFINFASNSITTVGENLLTGLTHLTSVDFFYNPCISQGAWLPEEIRVLNERLPVYCPAPQ